MVSCVLDYSSSGYFKHFAIRTHIKADKDPSFRTICLLLLKPANVSQVSPHPSPFFCERLNLGSLVLSYFVSSFSTLVSAVCSLSPFSPQIQTSNISCSARSSFSFCSWSRFSKSCTLQNLTTSHALMSNSKHCCTASHASHLLNFWTGSACRVREIFEKTGNGPKQGNTFEKTATVKWIKMWRMVTWVQPPKTRLVTGSRCSCRLLILFFVFGPLSLSTPWLKATKSLPNIDIWKQKNIEKPSTKEHENERSWQTVHTFTTPKNLPTTFLASWLSGSFSSKVGQRANPQRKRKQTTSLRRYVSFFLRVFCWKSDGIDNIG